MKKIALLGGSRFIGFHLLWELYRQGHDVTVFNRQLSPPPAPFPKGVRFVRGDRNHPEDLEKLFDKEFDVVFDISGSAPNQIEPIIRNYRSCIGHYIFLSSTSVYQKPPPNPLNEESPCIFTEHTNGGNKALAEKVLLQQYHSNRLPVTIFRPQGVFGPFDAYWAGLIFYRLFRSLPFRVLPEANKHINILYVNDLIRVFLSAMNNPNVYGSVYAVAGDDVTTLDALIGLCGKVSSIDPLLDFVGNPTVCEDRKYIENKRHVTIDIPWLKYDQVIDNSKIKRDLGINFTDLETSLQDTLSWLLKKPERLNYFALRGERYVLRSRPIPVWVRTSWQLTDALKDSIKRTKDIMKCVQWLKNSCRYLKRMWFIRLRRV